MKKRIIKNMFIFGLIIVLIGGSFLPVINRDIINNFEECKDFKQQIFQITFQVVSKVIKVEQKNGDMDVEEFYLSSKYLPRQSGVSDGYIIITADDLKDAVVFSDFIDWKTSIGFDVRIVSITDTEISSQPGVDLCLRD